MTFSSDRFLSRLAAAALPACLMCAAPPVFADESADAAVEQAVESVQDAAMPSEEELMAAWIAASTPGEHHATLAAMAGTFNAVVTHQMSPDAPIETSQAVSINTMILGGRGLQSHFKGEAMGMPFEGMGTIGYDNLAQQYVSTWMDTMGTNTIISRSTPSEDADILNFQVEPFTCPITGQPKTPHEVLTIHSADHHTFEWYETLPDGTEFLSMTINYTRVESVPENAAE